MIDETDIKILFILQRHGRRQLAEIAKDVDLSPPAVMERIKKLRARGIITGFHALIDAKKVGKEITAFVGVSISHQRYTDSFLSQMAAREDVLECHHVTGDESFILKVKTANTHSLEKFLAEVRSMEGVTRTITKVVLSTAKENHVLELRPEEIVRAQVNGGDGTNGEEKRRKKKEEYTHTDPGRKNHAV